MARIRGIESLSAMGAGDYGVLEPPLFSGTDPAHIFEEAAMDDAPPLVYTRTAFCGGERKEIIDKEGKHRQREEERRWGGERER